MNEVADNLASVRERVASACARAGRPVGSVRLVAVSKGVEAERIAAAAALGQGLFGESYLQEALAKLKRAEMLARRPLEWHFIGPLQANKTREIAAHFAWVHGVDREKIARRLSDARGADSQPLEVCIQVNISGEASKSGCTAAAAPVLCACIAGLPRIRLRGLMAIPSVETTDARLQFRSLRQLADKIRSSGTVDPAVFDTLSMGMSDDFEIAIEEGATLLRLGTSIFGPRQGRSTGVC